MNDTIIAVIVGGVISFMGTIIVNLICEFIKHKGRFLIYLKEITAAGQDNRPNYFVRFVNSKNIPVIMNEFCIYEKINDKEIVQYIPLQRMEEKNQAGEIFKKTYAFDTFQSGVISPMNVANIEIQDFKSFNINIKKHGELLFGYSDGKGRLRLYRIPDNCNHVYRLLDKSCLITRNYKGKIISPKF